MARPPLDNTPQFGPKGPPLTAEQAAKRAGISTPHFWKQVAAGNYPAPVYPSPRNPRWFGPEIDEANEQRRMLPRQAKLIRARSLVVAAEHTTARNVKQEPLRELKDDPVRSRRAYRRGRQPSTGS